MRDEHLAVVIPMKPFDRAKQRLQPALEDCERKKLARSMLDHVLATVRESALTDRVAVVSTDPEVQELANAFGFTPLPEANSGYNQAIEQASAWAYEQGATSLLILPGDLPWLTSEDLIQMLQLANSHTRAVVIAPDKKGTGTNGLLLRPPDLLRPAFGPDSFRRHRQLARAIGVEPIVYRSTSFAHDIDLPEDLHYLDSWPTLQRIQT